MKMLIFICATALTAGAVFAEPSDRPLPSRLIDSSERYLIMRDHQIANRFYVVPKVIQIREQILSPYGNQQEGCEAVNSNLKTKKLLVQTGEKLAQLNLDRLNVLAGIIEHEKTAGQRRLDLQLQKQKLEDEIVRLDPNDANQKAAIERKKMEIATIERQVAELNAELQHYQTLRTTIDTDQTSVLKQLKDLENEVAQFKERFTQVAAKIKLTLELPNRNLDDPEFRHALGFKPSDIVEYPYIVGLGLYSSAGKNDEADPGQSDDLADQIGFFTPDWSEQGFKYDDADFVKEGLSPDIRKKPLPQALTLEQFLSLLYYCVISAGSERQNPTLIPVRIAFWLPVWSDDRPMDGQYAEMFSHRLILSEAQWPLVEGIPEVALQKRDLRVGDPGEPSQFDGGGRYSPRMFHLEIINGPNPKPISSVGGSCYE